MDEAKAPQPVARWYMAPALAALAFMMLGCATLVLDLTTNPATLPLDQRATFEARPMWLIAANGVAVAAGTLGAIMLVLRRRLAEPFLLVSVSAAGAWFAGLFLVKELRDALSVNDFAVALVVTLLTASIYAFARRSRQRGWLR